MSFLQVDIDFQKENYNRILGELYKLNCDSLWEDDSSIKAYFSQEEISEAELRNALQELDCFSESSFVISHMKDENWNAKWEEAFDTVSIEDICFIYADFHEKIPGYKHYIKIAPKMAFGTGHHETTFMMIQKMENVSLKGKKVLDLGCGSGILSVFAALKESAFIDAIDIEKPSVENAEEHKILNNVHYNVYWGGVEDVPNSDYDIVLANINRKVLLENEALISKMIKTDGILLMSGVLEKDAHLIEDKYHQNFIINNRIQKGKWLCYEMKKITS